MKRMLLILPLLIIFPAFGEQPMSTWSVAYLGSENYRSKARPAAQDFGQELGKILERNIQVFDWEKQPRDLVFLITSLPFLEDKHKEKFAGKRKDSFWIKYPYQYQGKTVCLLASKDDFGCDFPANHFLRHFLDAEWVGPGEMGFVYDKQPDWRLPEAIDLFSEPHFEMRLWDADMMGMARKHLAGSSRMDFHHAFGRIYAPSKYAATLPEIYPLIDGKRFVPDPKGEHPTAGWQPCVGSKRVQDMAVEHVLRQTKEAPSLASVSLSVNDGSGNHCECKDCTALDPKGLHDKSSDSYYSDRYYRFYNIVAERVVKSNPEAYIAVLAYGPCGEPPKETKIHPNIIVFITTGQDPLQFQGSGAKSSLYQYHLDTAYPTIRHYPNMLAEFFRTSQRVGGVGYYAQMNTCWAMGGPKLFVTAQLLWDVNQSVDTLMNRYLDKCFGGYASDAMHAYFKHWEAIYARQQKHLGWHPFRTIEGWNANHDRKYVDITWRDIYHLDSAIEIAGASRMTTDERKRFELFATYYRWLRVSLTQNLLAKDFANPAWRHVHSDDEIFDKMVACLGQTAQFDQIWAEQISIDRSGWLLPQRQRLIKQVEAGERYYDAYLIEPLRTELESLLGTTFVDVFAAISKRRLADQDKQGLVAYYRQKVKAYPSLRGYFESEINRLGGKGLKNLMPNGGFEMGEAGGDQPGQPPTLPHWYFYDRVGMVEGSKAQYEWKDGNGYDGGRSIGCGPGKYSGLRGYLSLDKGKYRISFRYKTQKRKQYDLSVNVLKMKDVDLARLTSAADVKAIKNEQYIKFLTIPHPVSEGKWQTVNKVFESAGQSVYCVLLEPFWGEDDSWVWYDDLEIVKIF